MMTNRDLDRWIAENVMGWYSSPGTNGLAYFTSHYPWIDRGNGFEKYVKDWNPTESISDAFKVWDKMVEKHWQPSLMYAWDGTDRYTCTFHNSSRKLTEGATNLSYCLAICLAAKKAVEEKE